MPARTVVLERLVKYNGEQHMPLTPGEYTQLTGRAGRRGIDVEGHAVVLWNPDVDPAEVAGLASTRTFPLRSSFAPTYNMTINLVNQMGPAQAHRAAGTVLRAVSGRPVGRRSGARRRARRAACSANSRPNSAGATRRSSTTCGCAPRSPNGNAHSHAHRGCSVARQQRCADRAAPRRHHHPHPRAPQRPGRRAGTRARRRRSAAAGALRTPLGGPDLVGGLLGCVRSDGHDDAAQTGRAPQPAGAA